MIKTRRECWQWMTIDTCDCQTHGCTDTWGESIRIRESEILSVPYYLLRVDTRSCIKVYLISDTNDWQAECKIKGTNCTFSDPDGLDGGHSTVAKTPQDCVWDPVTTSLFISVQFKRGISPSEQINCVLIHRIACHCESDKRPSSRDINSCGII